MATHKVAVEPHPPGKSATPRLESKGRTRAGRFYTPRAAKAGGELKLPSVAKGRMTQQVLEDEGYESDPESPEPYKIERLKLAYGPDYKGEGRMYQVARGGKRRMEVRKEVLEEMRSAKIGLLVKEPQVVENPKATRRRELLASLPQIDDDAETARFMIRKFSDQLVTSHSELDQLRLSRYTANRSPRVNLLTPCPAPFPQSRRCQMSSSCALSSALYLCPSAASSDSECRRGHSILVLVLVLLLVFLLVFLLGLIRLVLVVLLQVGQADAAQDAAGQAQGRQAGLRGRHQRHQGAAGANGPNHLGFWSRRLTTPLAIYNAPNHLGLQIIRLRAELNR